MPKNKPTFFKSGVLAVSAVLCLGASAWAQDLNREGLKNNIAERVRSVLEQQQMHDEASGVTADGIRIAVVEPASVSVNDTAIDLYAIKANVEALDEGPGSDIMMIVDADGQLEISVHEISTGRSVLQDAQDSLQRKEIDPELGQTIFSGNGEREVVLVSDPLCPYCRQAFAFFMERKEHIGEMRMLHMAHESQPAAEFAVWSAMDGADTVSPMALTEFIYTDLDFARAQQDPGKAIAQQFMSRFPELAEKWGSAEQARYYLEGKYKEKTRVEMMESGRELGIQATPTVFIDGVPVEGWAPDRYEDLLEE